jgi:hypothetical protein
MPCGNWPLTFPFLKLGCIAMDDDALTGRALAAYFRADPLARQPSDSACGVRVHHDKAYVVLRNTSDTLAVFRVRNDGILKRLRRWPKDVET